jgi:hypothetical protein
MNEVSDNVVAIIDSVTELKDKIMQILPIK